MIALLLFVIVLLTALALISLYHRFDRSREPASPPYEEMHSSQSTLHSQIGDINSAIYECLYQGRVPESSIFFSAVEPRSEGGDRWDFTEILIELPEKDALHHLNGRIVRALKRLNPGVTHRGEESASGVLLRHVSVQGLYTHRIKLRSNGEVGKALPRLPRVAIIIDDLGYDLDIVRQFLESDLQISLSILPMAPHTAAIVEEGRKKNLELMLHLPMEPEHYPALNPGPGALLADMRGDAIRQVVASHLVRVTGASGVNNHMGSRFTRDRDKMAVVLGELKKRNMFYIDSRTTKETVAFTLARAMGVPTANRNVFLDNDVAPKAMRFQMERLLSLGRASGAAIGIGHPHERTLELLKAYGPRLKKEFKVVRAADLAG